MGFPIRKFPDQSLFAAPQNLSQRTTSFFASQRQGIHRIPLRHLIALIINAHPSAEADPAKTLIPGTANRPGESLSAGLEHRSSFKDQFASNISEDAAVCCAHWPDPGSQANLDRTRLGCSLSIPPSADQAPKNQTKRMRDQSDRIHSLFTMSNNGISPMGDTRRRNRQARSDEFIFCGRAQSPGDPAILPSTNLVEQDGIEPTTSCLQSTRSPN